jgi:hypothetical protein
VGCTVSGEDVLKCPEFSSAKSADIGMILDVPVELANISAGAVADLTEVGIE